MVNEHKQSIGIACGSGSFAVSGMTGITRLPYLTDL